MKHLLTLAAIAGLAVLATTPPAPQPTARRRRAKLTSVPRPAAAARAS